MSNQLSHKDLQAFRTIRNAAALGRPLTVRSLQKDLGYASPRSAAVILQRLAAAGLVRRNAHGKLQVTGDLASGADHARTVLVPLVGNAPCGQPLLAEENLEAVIPVSTTLAPPPHRYFLLHAIGDSMDQAGIQDGDLVLVRQQQSAENGDRVVALIDDAATIKQFYRSPNAVMLRPRTSNPSHQPIVVTRDFQIQGVVVTALPQPAGG